MNDLEFEELVRKSDSIADVLRGIGVVPRGGNYKVARKRIDRLGLDISHFTGQGWSRGKKVTSSNQKPLEYYLVAGSNIASHKLRLKLIKENKMEARCSICLNSEWMGLPISLELDHINGINNDNRLENLRILCPNCHAQTSTYRGKNINGGVRKLASRPDLKSGDGSYPIVGSSPTAPTCECGRLMSKRSKVCKQCYKRTTKAVWPDKETLRKMVEDSNFTQVAKQLGVSDNAVRKHL